MDWAAIKQEYICGNIGLRALAERHGVSKSHLMHKSSVEGWVRQREEYRSKTNAKTMQKTVERTSDTLAAIADMQGRVRLQLWELTSRKLSAMSQDGDIDSAELRRIEQVYCDMIASDAQHINTDSGTAGGIIQIPAVDMDDFERMRQAELERLEGKTDG